MSVVWEDEYDPSELDGFQVETESDEDQEWDSADQWLADEQYARDSGHVMLSQLHGGES